MNLLNLQQAAEYLGLLEAQTVYWIACRTKRITYFKVGKEIKFRREDLDEYLKFCKHEARKP